MIKLWWPGGHVGVRGAAEAVPIPEFWCDIYQVNLVVQIQMQTTPQEVLWHILEYVGSLRDQRAISFVCKKWRRCQQSMHHQITIKYNIPPHYKNVGHTNEVLSVAWSHCGTMLATGSKDLKIVPLKFVILTTCHSSFGILTKSNWYFKKAISQMFQYASYLFHQATNIWLPLQDYSNLLK